MTLPAAPARAAVLPRLPARPAKAASGFEDGVWALPFLLVLGYLTVDYGRPQVWFPPIGHLRPGMMMLGGSILMMVARQKFPTVVLIRYIWAFVLIMGVLVPFATNKFFAFNTTKDFTLFVLGAVMPMMVFVDRYERIFAMIRWWMFLHIPLALWGLTHRGSGGGAAGIGSFLGDENDFCLALNVALPYAFAMAILAKNMFNRLVMFAVCGLLLATVAATLSRGGFLGLVAVGAMIWLRSPGKVRNLAIVIVFVLGMALFLPQSYWDEMKTITSATEENDTGYGRMYAWGIAWKMFLHKPWGVGPSNFQFDSFRYENANEQDRGRFLWGHVSHSLYFTVLPEEGLIGTIIFFGMLIRGWRERQWARRDCEKALQRTDLGETERKRMTSLVQLHAAIDASLMTFLVSGAFITVLYYPHVWLLTAVTVAACAITKQELAKLPAVQTVKPVAARSRLLERRA